MIRSAFYETSDGMTSDNVAVISTGIPRSATTFVFQVLRQLHPAGGVVKTHCWLNLDSGFYRSVIATVRDFRDVVVSYWRTCVGDQNRVMTREEMVRGVGFCRLWEYHLGEYAEHGCLVLGYEAFVPNHGILYDAIEEVLGLNLTAGGRATMSRGFSLAANKGLAPFRDSLDQQTGWDTLDYTGMPGGHCHEGEIGAWRRFVAKNDWKFITDELADLLRRWDYEL